MSEFIQRGSPETGSGEKGNTLGTTINKGSLESLEA